MSVNTVAVVLMGTDSSAPAGNVGGVLMDSGSMAPGRVGVIM